MSGRRNGQRFDAENGVTTEALLFLGELDPEAIGDAMADATHYEPVPIADFDVLLAAVPQPYDGYTFVDAGSGMGRAVMLATLRPFRAIVGVEVSPALHEIAAENLAVWRKRDGLRCRDVRLARANAAEFAYPPGDLVVFLYNPFGAATLARTVARIVQTRSPRDRLFIAYHTPEGRASIDLDPAFELTAQKAFGRVYRRRS
ncbi:MAG TPA: class I SAM-dependent methyltransferase [Candidatus Baltobacteraceae bacterium]|jgi:16S rRNA G966 N2-methylase RsmD